MLHHLQPFMQCLLVIPFLNSNLFPADDRPGIYFRCHIVYAASCHLYSGVEGLLNYVQAAKDGDFVSIAGCIGAAGAIVRQEGGMYIDDTLRKLLKKFGAEDTHPTGQYDEISLKQLEQGYKSCFALSSLLPW